MANHHFVPQYYLKNFAKPRSKSGKLLCFDLGKRHTFTPTPRNVGSRRDYNRIDIEGYSPDHIENELAKIETEGDQAFRRILLSPGSPDPRDFEYVLLLLALMCANNPAFRKQRDTFMSDIARRVLNMTVASEERWNAIGDRMRADGVEMDPNVEFADVQAAVREGRIAPAVTREALIEQEMQLWANILPVLQKRNWTILLAEANAGEFATSDRPFCLQMIRSEGDHRIYHPGLGTAGTTLTFPISPGMAILGTFEGGGGVVNVDRVGVATVNSGTFGSALRQVYSHSDFPIFDTDGEVRDFGKSDLWARIRSSPAPRP